MMIARQEDYQVTIEGFHGPLDLLLYLIRRAEVDIHDIPIAEITDQYCEMLRHMREIDIDVAGEFLVMAASLIEIKSRMLMPPDEQKQAERAEAADSVDFTDPRFELVQQLMSYQRYRIASDELEKRRTVFMQRYPRRAARQQISEELAEAIELELEDAHPMDLAEAFERIVGSINFAQLGDHLVEIDDTPIELHERDLLDQLDRSPEHRLTLQDAFADRPLGQRIGMFLATLELTRMRRVTVQQDEIDDAILLILNEDPQDALIVETDAINQPSAEHDASSH